MPECVQAYLRFAGLSFVVEDCDGSGSSPTGKGGRDTAAGGISLNTRPIAGFLPALECGDDLIVSPGEEPAHELEDWRASRSVLAQLRTAAPDLDAHLGAAEKADLLAFGALVEHKLLPATANMMWRVPNRAAYDPRGPRC